MKVPEVLQDPFLQPTQPLGPLVADSDYTVICQIILVTQMKYFGISIFEEIQVSNIAQDSKHPISNASDEMSA